MDNKILYAGVEFTLLEQFTAQGLDMSEDTEQCDIFDICSPAKLERILNKLPEDPNLIVEFSVQRQNRQHRQFHEHVDEYYLVRQAGIMLLQERKLPKYPNMYSIHLPDELNITAAIHRQRKLLALVTA